MDAGIVAALSTKKKNRAGESDCEIKQSRIGKFVQLLPRIIFKSVGSLGKQMNQLILSARIAVGDRCMCSNIEFTKFLDF